MTNSSSTFWNGRRIGTCLLFLLGLAVLDRAIGLALDFGLRYVQTGQRIGIANAALSNRNHEIIIFGNSRARHHLMPSALTAATGCSSYNAGVNGHGVYYYRILESIMLSRATESRLFVVMIDPVALMITHPERARVLTPFVDENPTVRRLIRRVTTMPNAKLLSRAYRFNSVALPIVRNVFRPTPMHSDGFVPLHGSRVPADQGGLPIPEHHPRRIAVQEDAVDMLREFVEAARDNGTDVVFLKAPALHRWVEEQAGHERLEALAAELSVPLIVVDESTHEVLRDPALYQTLTHLNEQGAATFSNLVGEQFAELNLTCSGND